MRELAGLDVAIADDGEIVVNDSFELSLGRSTIDTPSPMTRTTRMSSGNPPSKNQEVSLCSSQSEKAAVHGAAC